MEEKNKKIELSYYGLFLKHLLYDMEDARKDDNDFINGRSDDAATEFEAARRQGFDVFSAQEMAMKVLLEGIQQ
jgi:hypothetical protein